MKQENPHIEIPVYDLLLKYIKELDPQTIIELYATENFVKELRADNMFYHKKYIGIAKDKIELKYENTEFITEPLPIFSSPEVVYGSCFLIRYDKNIPLLSVLPYIPRKMILLIYIEDESINVTNIDKELFNKITVLDINDDKIILGKTI